MRRNYRQYGNYCCGVSQLPHPLIVRDSINRASENVREVRRNEESDTTRERERERRREKGGRKKERGRNNEGSQRTHERTRMRKSYVGRLSSASGGCEVRNGHTRIAPFRRWASRRSIKKRGVLVSIAHMQTFACFLLLKEIFCRLFPRSRERFSFEESP